MNKSLNDPLRPYIEMSNRSAWTGGERCEFFPQHESLEYVLWVESDSGKRSLRIPDSEVAPIVEALRNVRLPLVDRFTGFGGKDYMLTIGKITSIQVSWSIYLPPEWDVLVPALAQIKRLSGIGCPELGTLET
jgi:hypothetical protein